MRSYSLFPYTALFRSASAAPGQARPLLVFRAWRSAGFGPVNWRGLWALYYGYGVKRFLRFGLETLAGPLVSSLLFLLVFVIGPIGRVSCRERVCQYV